MGKMLRTVSLLCVLSLLCGCASMLNRDYYASSRHISQTADTTDTSSLRVSSYPELVSAVQYFVSLGQEQGVVHLYQYTGNVEEDTGEACREVMTRDPLGAWALETADCSFSRIVSYYECTFTFSYRHDLSEISAIQQLTGTIAIRDALTHALSIFSPSLVIESSHYYTQTDLLLNLAQEAYYASPATALGLPEVTVTVYPADSTSGQRIAELSFTYPFSATLSKSRAQTVSAQASAMVGRSPATGTVGCWLLYSRLAEQLIYDPDGSTGIFAAFSGLPAGSEAAALAYELLCNMAEIPCRTVSGTKDGLPYWWNIVQVESGWRHIDPAAAADEDTFLRTDEEMAERYVWDTTQYPACISPDLSLSPEGLTDAEAVVETEQPNP